MNTAVLRLQFLQMNPRSDEQRIFITSLIALTIHAIVILFTGFVAPDPFDEEILPTMDVTLVNTLDESTPDEADYLAQKDHDGAGNTKEKTPPMTPPMAEMGFPTPGNARVDTLPTPDAKQRQTVESQEVMVMEDSLVKMETLDPTEKAQDKPAEQLQVKERHLTTSSVKEILAERMKISTEDSRQHRILSPKTKSSVEAAYLEQWRRKVELVGKLHYPKDRHSRELSGTLTMMVAVKPDGSLHKVFILKPSGKKILDDAAKRIVKLSAPFQPFPDAVRHNTDLLHIPRKWIFSGGSSLRVVRD